jgi:hypothetical protein
MIPSLNVAGQFHVVAAALRPHSPPPTSQDSLVWGFDRLSERAIVRLLSRLPSLESLELYWVLSVADEALLAMAAYNPKLVHLSLSGCKRVGDQGLRVLVGSCRNLTHLNLTR